MLLPRRLSRGHSSLLATYRNRSTRIYPLTLSTSAMFRGFRFVRKLHDANGKQATPESERSTA